MALGLGLGLGLALDAVTDGAGSRVRAAEGSGCRVQRALDVVHLMAQLV